LDRDDRRAAVVASPPLPPPFPMPAGTNSARGRFYPRGIDTGRDPEGGDCGETTIPRRDRRERAFERDGEDAENPVRDPARRVVRATPRGSLSRRPPNISCVSRRFCRRGVRGGFGKIHFATGWSSGSTSRFRNVRFFARHGRDERKR
jgi:hypothetical protein